MVKPTATVTQCAVLTGDLSAYPGALPAPLRGPLAHCGDRPFLAWLMREFVRYGVTEFLLLTSRLSAKAERAVADIQASLPRTARITLSTEPVGAGTGGAVFQARKQLDDRFLLCNGTSLFDCNLAKLLADAAVDDLGVLGRILLRRSDEPSQYGTVSIERDRVTALRNRPTLGSGTMVNGGVYMLRKSLIDRLGEACSLEGNVLPQLAVDGALRGTVASGYFRDMELPGDAERAQTEIPKLLHRKALFMDRDGVLNIDNGYVGSLDRFEWVDGALDAIRYATQAGWHVFIVTNQSGVARGLFNEAAVRALLDWVGDEARRIGGTIDDWRYCPFHPDAAFEWYRRAHSWRKPLPGMLLDLMDAWMVDPSRALMIGDQRTDMDAAAAAGVPGRLFRGGNLLSFIRPLIDARR